MLRIRRIMMNLLTPIEIRLQYIMRKRRETRIKIENRSGDDDTSVRISSSFVL